MARNPAAPGGENRGHLHHHLGVEVERVVQPRGVGVDLAKGEVVEVFGQLGSVQATGRDLVAEQLVTAALSGVGDGHRLHPRRGLRGRVLLIGDRFEQVVASPLPAASRIA